MAALRRLYGAHPVHLVAVLAAFAVAAAALARLRDAGPLDNLVLWLAGAIVLHDLVLYPIYAVADRMALGLGRRRRPGPPAQSRGAINYLRIPTLLSGLLLLLFFPLILRATNDYERVSGIGPDPFLTRWLWISAALFAGSGVLYAVRRLRRRRRARQSAS